MRRWARAAVFVAMAAAPPGCGGRVARSPDSGPDWEADAEADVDADGDAGTDGDADADADCDVSADRDLDGLAGVACGGDDCDDSRADVHPGAPDGERSWHVETVREGPLFVGTFAGIAARPDQSVDIVYLIGSEEEDWDQAGATLQHSFNASGDWQHEWVADIPGTNSYNAMLRAEDGSLHVSYRHHENREVRYATNASGAWQSEVVDGEGDPGYWTAIAVQAGSAHAAYWDIDSNVVSYATNEGGSWVIEDVASDVDVWSGGLAVDDAGLAHVVYADRISEDIVHATPTGGGWSAEIVDAGPNVDNMSLVRDDDGALHVAYRTGVDLGGLRYATNASGAWVTENLEGADEDGGRCAIAIGSDGVVHIVFAGSSGVRYATNESGVWVTEAVVHDDSEYPAVAIEGDEVHVAFRDGVLWALSYAVLSTRDGIDQDCDGQDG